MSQLKNAIFARSSSTYSSVSMLPPQTVSIKEKESDEWKQGVMNFMVQEARMQMREKQHDLQKLGMLSGDYTYKNHTWAVDPLNLGDEKEKRYGATDPIQHYPIMNSPLNTILGERINRNIQFYCLSESPASFNAHHRDKAELLLENVAGQIQQNTLRKVMMKARAEGIELDESVYGQLQQQAQQMAAPQIQEYMDKSWIDVIEQSANRMMRNMWKKNHLDEEFIEGFRLATAVGKEFYRIDVNNNRVSIKNLSSFSVFFHKSPHSRWVSKGQYAGYRIFLTPSAVIDLYRDKLTVEDIEAIEEKLYPNNRSQGVNSLTGIKSIDWSTNVFADNQGQTWRDVNYDLIEQMVTEFMATGNTVARPSTAGLIEVVQAYWKSYRKVGWLHYYDEEDNEQKELVDENYVPDKDKSEWVQWFYLNQVYQGTCIDQDMYLCVEPYPHQIFDKDDPDFSPLPIEGCYYSEINGKAISLVDLMIQWAELYDIVAHELKKDLKKAMGKVMYMSIDHIPNIPGFDEEKWMYWCKEFGIAWVGSGKQRTQFSHYQAADMSFAEQINAKILLLDKIKMNCDAFAGFSQPRLANTSNEETAAQSRMSQMNSVNQTEYYFWKHSQLIQRVLTTALNISKKLVKKDIQYLRNLYDDMEQRYLTTDAAAVQNPNVGLYVVHGALANARKEAVRQAALVAAGKTGGALDMSELILAETENEIKHVLRKLQRKADAIRQQQMQHEQELEDKRIADQQAEREWDKEKHYSELASNERQEYMRTFMRQDDNLKDTDADAIPDVLEYSEHFEKVNDNARKHQREMSKIEKDADIKNRELQIKKEKLSIDRDKNKIARENMENDAYIARQNAKGRGKSKK